MSRMDGINDDALGLIFCSARVERTKIKTSSEEIGAHLRLETMKAIDQILDRHIPRRIQSRASLMRANSTSAIPISGGFGIQAISRSSSH